MYSSMRSSYHSISIIACTYIVAVGLSLSLPEFTVHGLQLVEFLLHRHKSLRETHVGDLQLNVEGLQFLLAGDIRATQR